MSTPKKMVRITSILVTMACMSACGGSDGPSAADKYKVPDGNDAGKPSSSAPKAGLLTAADLKLGEIDHATVEKGKSTYDVKCQACHSLGENRVVGPGWKGVTTRREPVWIMNMIVHTDAMLSADPEAQKLLEQCLVRMPNQNLSMEEARQVLEFMRTL